MIALIENACVEKKGWITHDEMMNVTVIAESTPGPIAINAATFVGYKVSGFWGAFFSTLGIFLHFIHHYLSLTSYEEEPDKYSLLLQFQRPLAL